MQTFTQTVAGAQTLTFNVPGKYFVLLASQLGVNIRFYRNGKRLELGEIQALLPGVEAVLGDLKDAEPSFTQVQIDALGADTISFGIGNGQVRYNRSQGNVAITNLNGAVTQSQNTVANTAGTLVAANATRRYLLIQNKDGTGNVFINFTTTATVANGIKIAPGGSFMADSSFCPNNVISAIGDIASNANVIVVTG